MLYVLGSSIWGGIENVACNELEAFDGSSMDHVTNKTVRDGIKKYLVIWNTLKTRKCRY